MTDERIDEQRDDQDEEVQSDVISEKMAKVIDETDAEKSEIVTPHWEVVENEGGDPTIYHLHDGNQVPASMTAGDQGENLARCSQCGAEINLGGTVREREPAGTRSS